MVYKQFMADNMKQFGCFVLISTLLIAGCGAKDATHWHTSTDLHYLTYGASDIDSQLDSAWSGKLVRVGDCVGVERDGRYLIQIPDSYELVANESGQFALRHGTDVYPFDREYTGGGVTRESLDMVAGRAELQKCAAEHAVTGIVMIYTVEK